MYFDPRPKTCREDLYNRERELREFKLALKVAPLVAVTGIRRMGKTSLILVGLSDKPSVIIDLRGVSQSRMALYKRIEHALNDFFKSNRNIWSGVRDKLKIISGVEVFGVGVSLSWGKEKADLATLLKSLEEYGVIIVFDEIQYVRGPIGKELMEAIAYLYDHSELRIVVSGSEVGLLYDFLGVENPRAPLYGRYFREVRLKPFTEEQSLDFLIKGFKQYGLEVPDNILREAVEMLDGIVGWLVYFGLKYIENRDGGDIVREIVDEASKLSFEEFMKFAEKHIPATKRLRSCKSYSFRRKHLDKDKTVSRKKREKRTIPDMSLSRILKTLQKSSYVDKRVEGRNVYYTITDPTLRYALRQLT